jgi:hypothetical protein
MFQVWVFCFVLFCFCCCVFEVLGFELRAYTSSDSNSPFFCYGFFKIGLAYLLGLTSSHNLPDLCLLSS